MPVDHAAHNGSGWEARRPLRSSRVLVPALTGVRGHPFGTAVPTRSLDIGSVSRPICCINLPAGDVVEDVRMGHALLRFIGGGAHDP